MKEFIAIQTLSDGEIARELAMNRLIKEELEAVGLEVHESVTIRIVWFHEELVKRAMGRKVLASEELKRKRELLRSKVNPTAVLSDGERKIAALQE